MKTHILLLALAAMFVFGCNESPSSHTPGSNLPNAAGDGPDAIFDIPTPSITGGTVSGNVNDGFCIHLTWDSNTPGYADGYSSYVKDPTSPTDINDGHGWEYWGNTQVSIVIYNNAGHHNYSGHYEVYRDGVHIADVTGDEYDDCGLEAGTYTYTIKAKSRETASGDNNDNDDEMTHHSQLSDGFEVSTCEETELSPSFAINPLSGGNGSWSADGTTWTENASHTNQNANIIFNIYEWTRTQNSCTGDITSTPVDGGYTGDCYLSIDNGVTWRQSLAWSLNNEFQSNGNNPGGNGSGLGKFDPGTYTVIYSSTASTSGQMGTFSLVVPPHN